jgi:hypothetical protein
MLFKSAFISPKRLTERFFIFYRKFVSFFFSVGVIILENMHMQINDDVLTIKDLLNNNNPRNNSNKISEKKGKRKSFLPAIRRRIHEWEIYEKCLRHIF